MNINLKLQNTQLFYQDEGDDVVFIDPTSREGKRFLSDPETTVPEIFAVMRQSVSPVANHIDAVVREVRLICYFFTMHFWKYHVFVHVDVEA